MTCKFPKVALKNGSFLFALLLATSCKTDPGERSFNRAQIIIMCVDKAIKENPEEWRLPYQKQQCAERFPAEYCYYERDL